MISHLFRQPGPVAVLTHFVIEPAAFSFLVAGVRFAVVFLPRQQSTRCAVPVAVVAKPADSNFLLTSLAVEKAAIWWCHLYAPTKGLYRDVRKRDAPSGASMTTGVTRSPDVSGGPGGYLGPHPTEALKQLSHNPIHLRNLLDCSFRSAHRT